LHDALDFITDFVMTAVIRLSLPQTYSRRIDKKDQHGRRRA
jgi:hypothetical protein